MKLISLVYLIVIARPSFSLPLVNGDLSLLNQEDDNSLDVDKPIAPERSNRNSSVGHENNKSQDLIPIVKEISESGHNKDDSLQRRAEPISETAKNAILKTKIHRRKSVESSNSKIVQPDVTNVENDSKIRMCVHKFNVAQTNGVVDGSPLSNTDYDEYEEYENREPMLRNVTLPDVGNVKVELCSPQTSFCYALWTEDPKDGKISILGQGCWKSSERQTVCKSDACRTDKPPSRANPETKFCCCKSQFCNLSPASLPSSNNSLPVMEYVPSVSPATDSVLIDYKILILVAASCIILVLITSLCYISKCVIKEKEANSDGIEPGNNIETGGPGFACSTTCVDNLKLHDNIGSGKHAKVWRGSLGGIPVAVKALPASRITLWARERDLYSLPHMRHPNLLQYFGCDTRPTFEGPSEHLLVLQLAPLGSLRNFLIDNTLDWEVYTNMALGIASALAHLHTHIDKDSQYKPCIVHRDVNSSNIVVRADLTCCLGDLGLAMSLPENKAHSVQPQTHRIQEAGTLRYLAPEALEGTLDLRRCAASLRAVDVYALSLVLWELLSRCSDLHRAPGPLTYAPPFQAEVGDQPTLEKMQVIVARHKARPLFSPRLLSVRATRLARDTCEDCWDHDADARLTAVCVVERLTELRSMRPAPSPTINNNDLRPPTQNYDNSQNWHSPGSCEDKNSNVTSSAVFNSNNLIDFQATVLNKLPLQPHQGRNPCLERNLASVGNDDRLIDKSLKDMSSISPTIPSNNDYGSNSLIRIDNSTIVQNIRNAPQDFSRPDEHSANIFNYSRNTNRNYSNQNSFISQPNSMDINAIHDEQLEFRQMIRPVTPIGYVQNDVSGDVNSAGFSNGEGNPHGYPAKKSNVPQEATQSRWGPKRIKHFLDSKLFKKKSTQNQPVPLETEVNLVLSNGKPVNNSQMNSTNGKFKTSVIINDARNKINRDSDACQSDSSCDRPSSLPGIDSVVLNGITPDSSSRENRLRCDGNVSGNKNLNYLENNMCAISPPNQTISHSMMLKSDDKIGTENFISGFKELPAFAENNIGKGTKSSNQVFAVIVPKTNYNVRSANSNRESDITEWQQRNNIELPSSNTNNDVETQDHNNSTIASKRLSCDEKFVTSVGNNSSNKKDNLCKAYRHNNRNSYSGEFETGNFCKYNKEDDTLDSANIVDYSSNSEDEHMLLLSENGGSKITMRQRHDVKPSQDSKNIKKNKFGSSSHSVHDSSGSGLSKIATESFSSLCNKYGVKSKYENFKNETNNLQQPLLPKDAASIDHGNKKLRLSICKNSNEDLNSLQFNQPTNSNESEDANDSEKTLNSNMKCNLDSDSSSAEDITLPEEAPKRNNSFRPLSIKQNLSRQHSLELVSELFSSSADLTRLKDPASRIKTPGDVPPSVRKMRGSRIRRTGSAREKSKVASNRLSLYDDRMMFGNSL